MDAIVGPAKVARSRSAQTDHPAAVAWRDRDRRNRSCAGAQLGLDSDKRFVAHAIVRYASELAIPFLAKHSSNRGGHDDRCWAKARAPRIC
jgi:hypothetical protein